MREISLSIPTLEAEQNVEIDVRINGRKKTLKYRVEIIHWEDENPDTEQKVTTLRHYIKEYDKDWELIQIGAPETDRIPLMFRSKNSKKD
ncbi:MAG: hypothetical protein RAO94_10420 [Candidatus Stygibacter australis]|nr:hypothetical protein [Candidatus Stygibacter australis]MDP8322752.1 hypothetical protein [Candidatus Stygibacter australis]